MAAGKLAGVGDGDGGPLLTASVARACPRPPRRHYVFLLSTMAIAWAYVFYSVPGNTSPPSYHSLFLSLGSNATAAAHLRALTARPHVAGTRAGDIVAAYVSSAFSSVSIRSHSVYYSVLLSYPISRSLTLYSGDGADAVRFSLVQEPYANDPYENLTSQVMPTFYAYSASGNVSADAVYANYGRLSDFALIGSLGIDMKGKIALVRYGMLHCEDIVYNARISGAVAAVVYVDRQQYGGTDGEKCFPEGRWTPPSGVQVGSLFRGVGDPTTPMWASTDGCERLDISDAMGSDEMPRIPALPVSMRDGETILEKIGGPIAPKGWQGGAAGGAVPVYRIGPGPAMLNLSYIGNDTMARIHNVFGVIDGAEEPDRYVILGNHRDAWTFGAADPNSGTAAMLELAHRLEVLREKGWRPRRTIMLCSWDAEEYGLTGSTEWVEENRDMLSLRAVAYLNIDVSVVGAGFTGSATPQLDELLIEVTKKVPDPDNLSQTVFESWSKSSESPLIGRLGGGGTDYAAFLQHVGVPSFDMTFGTEGPSYPVYHTLYDDFVWMQNFGDPGFHRHVAAASIWGLLALRLADDVILPFNYVSYALELQKDAKVLEKKAADATLGLSFTPLHDSISAFGKAAHETNTERKELERALENTKEQKRAYKARDLNDRLMMTERAFTSQEGLLGNQWSKHLVYGTADDNDWESSSFPGITAAIDAAKKVKNEKTVAAAQHEVYRASRAVTQASSVLTGRLT